MVKAYIKGTFHKNLERHSLKIAFDKANLCVELATPMDENPYFADKRKIDYFYTMLSSFCQAHKIPAHFVLFLDEEGHEEYSDSKKVKVDVPLKDKGKDHNYPVSRKNDHTTFLACITADGSFLNPLIVIKRQTIDVRFYYESILDKIMLASNESGFINSDIFDDWLEKHFVPNIQLRHLHL